LDPRVRQAQCTLLVAKELHPIEHSEQCLRAGLPVPASNVAPSHFGGNIELQARQEVGATLRGSASTTDGQYSSQQVSRTWQDDITASSGQTTELFTFNKQAQDRAAAPGRWQETNLPLQEPGVTVPISMSNFGHDNMWGFEGTTQEAIPEGDLVQILGPSERWSRELAEGR
jgi:hypothetical protein